MGFFNRIVNAVDCSPFGGDTGSAANILDGGNHCFETVVYGNGKQFLILGEKNVFFRTVRTIWNISAVWLTKV